MLTSSSTTLTFEASTEPCETGPSPFCPGVPVCAGPLAVVSASGGTPRELAENVSAADWTPDGGALAALRIAGDRQHVEFPLGRTLYESPDRMFIIRVSPDGKAVAFFERMEGAFSIVVVDRS